MRRLYFILFLASILFSINLSSQSNYLPINEDTLNTTHVLFSWGQLPQTDIYKLQLAEVNLSDIHSSFETNLITEVLDSTLMVIVSNGIEWNKKYIWRIGSYDYDTNDTNWGEERIFYTLALPDDIPNFIVNTFSFNNYSPGITMFNISTKGIALAVDIEGKVVWFIKADSDVGIFLRPTYLLYNGNLLSLLYTSPGGKSQEITINNNLIWESPNSTPYVHHDVFPMPNSNYLALTYEQKNGPIPDGPWDDWYAGYDSIPWRGDVIKEWNSNNEEIWSWSVFDYFNMLDYDSTYFHRSTSTGFNDWTHSNSIFYSYNDSSIYLSSRHLSRITKIDYHTKDIIWMIGDQLFSDDVLGGNDLNFSWQHSVKVINNGNILFFDNGNLNNPQISRVLEINVTETDSFPYVDIMWEYILPKEKFSNYCGDADRLNNGNTLITSGEAAYILEIDSTSSPVWDLQMQEVEGAGTFMYRSERYPDLYPQAYSIVFSNYYIINEQKVIDITDNNTIEFTIYNESWENHTYTYTLVDSLNLFTDIGTSVVNSKNSVPLSLNADSFQEISLNPATLIITSDNLEEISDTINFVIYNQSLSIEDKILYSNNLKSIYPNPFNASTTIKYSLSRLSNVKLKIYDINGTVVEIIYNGIKGPGDHEFYWIADTYASGVYFVKMVAGDYVNTQKLMLVK